MARHGRVRLGLVRSGMAGYGKANKTKEERKIKVYTAEIEGIAPLLMHRFDEGAQADLEQQVKKAKRDLGTPEDQAERAAYRLENGNLYLPAEAIYCAMVKAGAGVKIVGGRGKTYKASIAGNVNITPDYIDLGVKNYAIDRRKVKIQNRACMRSRPRLDEWRAAFKIEVFDEEAIPKEVLQAVLATAGQGIGLLDYRPRFGRFMVVKFD